MFGTPLKLLVSCSFAVMVDFYFRHKLLKQSFHYWIYLAWRGTVECSRSTWTRFLLDSIKLSEVFWEHVWSASGGGGDSGQRTGLKLCWS